MTKESSGRRLTYVAGDRAYGDLDPVSQKIVDSGQGGGSGTSIFDPVLCEIAYRWFCPSGGSVLDPFGGGSVRGIVAAALGHPYTGIDLRPEQNQANEAQWRDIAPGFPNAPAPRWLTGDSRDLPSLAPGQYDLIFTCPPYADLEVYSDDPRDLSTLSYDQFRADYAAILRYACSLLRPNRFAVLVVGDVRDKDGLYRGFPWHTIEAMQDAGARLYNEAILVTVVGSLPIRVGRQFGDYRKLGKTHQQVLCFYKGDPKAIKANLGTVDVADPAERFGEVV